MKRTKNKRPPSPYKVTYDWNGSRLAKLVTEAFYQTVGEHMFNKQKTYELRVLTEYIHTHVDIKRHIGEDLGLHQWRKENCWERTRPFSDSFNGERCTETENGTGFRFGTNPVQANQPQKGVKKQESRCFGLGPLKLRQAILHSPVTAQHFHGPLSATDKITTTTASFLSLFFFF